MHHQFIIVISSVETYDEQGLGYTRAKEGRVQESIRDGPHPLRARVANNRIYELP